MQNRHRQYQSWYDLNQATAVEYLLFSGHGHIQIQYVGVLQLNGWHCGHAIKIAKQFNLPLSKISIKLQGQDWLFWMDDFNL